MADPTDLYPPIESINEMNQAGFPAGVVAILQSSLHRHLMALEWQILFQSANLFGPPTHSYRIPVEFAGIL